MLSTNDPSATKNEPNLINSESKTAGTKPSKRTQKKKKIALRPGSPFNQSEITGSSSGLKGIDRTLAQMRLGYCQLMTEFIKGDGIEDDAFAKQLSQLEIQITESLRHHLQTSQDKNEAIKTPTLEKFYPLIGYLGLSKILHTINKFVGLDFHNLVELYSYATTNHITTLHYDTDAKAIEYLYDDLPQSEDFEGELHAHRELDELLMERRKELRAFLFVSIKNHMEHGAYSPDFKTALSLIARNHDVEFMEFIFNWIEENKNHPERANKSEQYLRLIGAKLLESFESKDDQGDKIFLHLLERVDIDFNKIKIEQHALYIQDGSGKKSYYLLTTTPLHIAVHLGDKLNYDIAVKKTKNLSVKCEATPCDKPIGSKKMPWEVNDLGFTPLHIAIVLDRDPIVKDLINRHSDIDAKTTSGFLPLNLADLKSHFGLVKYLVVAHTLKNAKLPVNERRDLVEFFKNEATLCYTLIKKSAEPRKSINKEDKSTPIVFNNTPFANFVNRNQVELKAEEVSTLNKYFSDLGVEYKDDEIEFNLLHLARKIRHSAIKNAGEKFALSLVEFNEVIASLKNFSFTNVTHRFFHYIKNKFAIPAVETKAKEESTVSISLTPVPVALALTTTPIANKLSPSLTSKAKAKHIISPKKNNVNREKTAEIQARINERQRNKPQPKPKRPPQLATPISPLAKTPQTLEAKPVSPVLSHSLFRKNSFELDEARMADLILEIDDRVSPLFGSFK